MMNRFKTREVMVGNIGVGGSHPIRIQSMTTSNTRDVQATVEQVTRLADAGCEIVRVTVQGMKEAEACEAIKNKLIQGGYTIPLVADIHFYPPAAMRVVDFVDKVRINPGNFVDKRASFKTLEYSDASYAMELERIEEKFTPLVEKCKRLNRAMRIGANHGSLSDRIMNRYGDTPQGMLESALEFARVCQKNDYHDFVFSMKSSNPKVMIQAYRLLVEEMQKLGWDYPLHLGVTEAGEGEDGRIKSGMGIGSLLLDGIGDTIRISLTEDPWYEIDPCKRLIQFTSQKSSFFLSAPQIRQVEMPKNMSLHRDGSVVIGINRQEELSPDIYEKLGFSRELGGFKLTKTSVDCLVHLDIPSLHEIGVSTIYPLTLSEAEIKCRFSLSQGDVLSLVIKNESAEQWQKIHELKPSLIVLSPDRHRFSYCRSFFDWLRKEKIATPVILNFSYSCSKEDLILQTAAEMGGLLIDGLGEGVWISGNYEIDFLRNLSFNLLQAARKRTFKTDFISCPSCGRTLFDLQEVSRRIRERTSHLPGVKIAIMGCIVNGPGEMADAHFGYVGSRPGMIDLYVGKECIEKNIAFEGADDRLVELIKKHNRWVEPEI